MEAMYRGPAQLGVGSEREQEAVVDLQGSHWGQGPNAIGGWIGSGAGGCLKQHSKKVKENGDHTFRGWIGGGAESCSSIQGKLQTVLATQFKIGQEQEPEAAVAFQGSRKERGQRGNNPI